MNDEPINTALPWWPDRNKGHRPVGHPMQDQIEHERQHPLQQATVGPVVEPVSTQMEKRIPIESITGGPHPLWEPTRPAAVKTHDIMRPPASDRFIHCMVGICFVGIVGVLTALVLRF